MTLHEGSRVLVNLAPFIGSPKPSSQSVPCTIATLRGEQIEVTPEPPYRPVTLLVDVRWIQRRSAEHEDLRCTVPS